MSFSEPSACCHCEPQVDNLVFVPTKSLSVLSDRMAKWGTGKTWGSCSIIPPLNAPPCKRRIPWTHPNPTLHYVRPPRACHFSGHIHQFQSAHPFEVLLTKPESSKNRPRRVFEWRHGRTCPTDVREVVGRTWSVSCPGALSPHFGRWNSQQIGRDGAVLGRICKSGKNGSR